MWELPLSYVILEFYCWNPRWDEYLTHLAEERQKKYEQQKNVQTRS